MKKSFLPVLAACGVLLPTTTLHAASDDGFSPGKTFTFEVTKRSSIKTKGFKVTKNVQVPDGIPDLVVGQNVKFTIGAKGQLTGSGFSIKFRRGEGRVNFYSNNPTLDSAEGEAATVTKTAKGRPTEATLAFYTITFEGFIPVTHTVKYNLE